MGDRARAHAGDRAPGMAAGRWVGGVRGAGGFGASSRRRKATELARAKRGLGLRTGGDSDWSAALTRRKGETEGGACLGGRGGCGAGWCGPVVSH
jgi:hypothetical protein